MNKYKPSIPVLSISLIDAKISILGNVTAQRISNTSVFRVETSPIVPQLVVKMES